MVRARSKVCASIVDTYWARADELLVATLGRSGRRTAPDHAERSRGGDQSHPDDKRGYAQAAHARPPSVGPSPKDESCGGSAPTGKRLRRPASAGEEPEHVLAGEDAHRLPVVEDDRGVGGLERTDRRSDRLTRPDHGQRR